MRQFARNESYGETEWAEWPLVGFVLSTAITCALIALQGMDILHELSTSYSLSDNVRVFGLKYANYSIVPLLALATYPMSRLGWKSWPAAILIAGIPIYFVKNWRGTQIMPGTFDRIDGTLTPWVTLVVIGVLAGYLLGGFRPSDASESRIVKGSFFGLAGLAGVTAFCAVTIQVRNLNSMFAPGRPYALCFALILCCLLTAFSYVSYRRFN